MMDHVSSVMHSYFGLFSKLANRHCRECGNLVKEFSEKLL